MGRLYLNIRVFPDRECATEEEVLAWSDENLSLTGDYEQTVALEMPEKEMHYLLIGMKEIVVQHRVQIVLPESMGALASKLRCSWSTLQQAIIRAAGLPESDDLRFHFLPLETSPEKVIEMDQLADIEGVS
jgi:hypothetical protein